MNHTYPIVGSYYRPPAPSILAILPIGTNLYLRPDPNGTTTNSDHNDPTAIAVYISPQELHTVVDYEGKIDRERSSEQALILELASSGIELDDVLSMEEIQLGYIPKALAAKLKPPEHYTKARFTTLNDGKPAVTFIEVL